MAKKTKNEAAEQIVPAGYVPELKTVYKEQIVPALMKQFSYTTVMQVPRLVKITINEGIGEASQNQDRLQHSLDQPHERKQYHCHQDRHGSAGDKAVTDNEQRYHRIGQQL